MVSTFLIWGGNGWIGSMLKKLLIDDGHKVYVAQSLLEDYIGINHELKLIKPDFVLNTAGITGRPTVDWCENNKQETYLINTIGMINLADACHKGGYHLTNYATGCIYTYDSTHPIGTKFSELDAPNFDGSTYSKSKRMAEELLKNYDNVLTLRIRMPISEDLNPKSLVTKLSKYAKVINIPNSMTILSEMLPISLKMAQDKRIGTYNFTNPGAIGHNEILLLYKKYVNPEIVWATFTEAEQNAILQSKRSNCELNVDKLLNEYGLDDIHTAVEKVMIKLSKLQSNK